MRKRKLPSVTPASQFWSWEDFLLLLVLALLALAIQFAMIKVPALSDQLDYFHFAELVPGANPSPSHRSLRLGVTLPVGLLIEVFGYSEFSYYFLPIFSLVFLVFAIYSVARIAFSRVTGVLSAVCFLGTFYVFWDSSHLLPDIPATGSFLASIAIIFLTEQYNDRWSVKKVNVMYTLAGAFLGWAYLCRETIVLLFPLILIILLLYRVSWKSILFFLVGAAAIYSIEFFWGLIFYGNPFVRLGKASPRTTSMKIEFDLKTILLYFPAFSVDRSGGIYQLFIYSVGLLGSVIWAFRKEKHFILLAIWSIGFWSLYTLLGSLPVLLSWENSVVLRLHKYRYWLPLLPPLLISGFAVLERLVKNFLQKKHFVIVMTLLLVFTGFQGYLNLMNIFEGNAFVRNYSTQYLELREFLAGEGENWDTIWVNEAIRGTGRVVPIYAHTILGKPIWDGEFRVLNEGESYLEADEITTGLFVVIQDQIKTEHGIASVPDYYVAQPDEWKIVFQSDNSAVRVFAVP